MKVADILAKTAGWNSERAELVLVLEKAQAALEKFDQKVVAEIAKLQPDKPVSKPVDVGAYQRDLSQRKERSDKGKTRKTTGEVPTSQPMAIDSEDVQRLEPEPTQEEKDLQARVDAAFKAVDGE